MNGTEVLTISCVSRAPINGEIDEKRATKAEFEMGFRERDLFDEFAFAIIVLVAPELPTLRRRRCDSPGGSLLFSMSMATTLMISTQMGQSMMSSSDFTKASDDRHCISSRRRSGYARLNSRLTFDWNFFMSKTCGRKRYAREHVVTCVWHHSPS
jgi:hypothetical protein